MNLSRDMDGLIQCPKFNERISPDVHNLVGCRHCQFAQRISEGKDGRTLAVGCTLVPRIPFCKRQRFEADSISCLVTPDLEEFRNLTGELGATRVPVNFVVPRPVTFTQCLLCAATGNSRWIPIEHGLEQTRMALEECGSMERRHRYPRPQSPEARGMRAILQKLNPGWSADPQPTPEPPEIEEPKLMVQGPGEGQGMEKIE